MRILLTRRKLISNIIGIIYEMAPGNNPRNINKIADYIIQYCKEHVKDYYTECDSTELCKYIKDMMFKCEEFTQLNISQKLWDLGVRDYNDKRNSGFGITAVGHDDEGQPCNILTPKEYADFIDLDACIGNIANEIIFKDEYSDDCFLCKYAKEYQSTDPSNCKECQTCVLNPNYKYNRVTHPKALLPRNSEEYKNYKD